MGKIKILSPDVIAKIAAGEVIERPASVVKELVENALDAGSTEIKIEAEAGGRRLIRVTDNGDGMTAEDARLAVERHATSKIEDAEDLSAIQTFGFRGEALAAIGAVSRMTIVTKRASEVAGTELKVEGGILKEPGETGCRAGTAIEVRDLFFNTPARLKFLKAQGTELAHIGEVIAKMALANPQVHFQFFHEGRRLSGYPVREDPSARLAEVLGRKDGEKMHFFRGGHGALGAEGFAGAPDVHRANSRGIFLFVNSRPVWDRLLLHGVLEAYRNLLPPNRYPAVILFVKIPPDLVDVNVHPSKWEVKFAESEPVHRLVIQSIRDMLEKTPWLSQPQGKGGEFREGPTAYVPAERKASLPLDLQAPLGWPARETGFPVRDSIPFLGQVAQTYLLFSSSEGLILVDQHAAHERVLFERLQNEFSRGSLPPHPLLIPESVELSFRETKIVEESLPQLEQMGFTLEGSGERTFWVKSVPQILSGRAAMAVLREIVQELSSWEKNANLRRSFDPLLRLLACHSAIQASQTIQSDQAKTLLTELQKCKSPSNCPHGRPTLVKITVPELEKMFGRK